MNRLTKVSPSMRGRCCRRRSPASIWHAEIGPGHLLHAALLLLEGHPRDTGRLATAGEALNVALPEVPCCPVISHPQTTAVGRYRKNATHHPRALNLITAESCISSAAATELTGIYAADSAGDA